MALTNFTDSGVNQQALGAQYCSAELTGDVHGELTCLSVVNTFLSITAFLGNALILLALRKETSLHPPSKLLYRNLAITDLCVGFFVEPLVVIYGTSVVNERWDICYYTDYADSLAGYTLCTVSLLTSTAISVDRLLALLLGLRYRQVVTLRRTCITAIGFWIFSIVGASSFFWNPIISSFSQYIGIALCLFITIFAYTKIFFTLCHNQIHVDHAQSHAFRRQPSQAIPLNIARYRKAVYSAM